MPTSLEELRVLQAAEQLADGLWGPVCGWQKFARETVGQQLVRAADSIGANIAEAFGRYHYGEKIQFLYYARGSLFETKYWLNRATARGLLAEGDRATLAEQLNWLAKQINAFAASLKAQRAKASDRPVTLREQGSDYNPASDNDPAIFSAADLTWLGDHAQGT